MMKVGVVTGSRADYGIYLPLLQDIISERSFELWLYVTGTHLSAEFGHTVSFIEKDGFIIRERVEVILASDSPEAVAKAMGLGTIGFAQIFARQPPDLLIVLGDRFEMHAAALAALPFKIPVAHIHGGEVTEGAIDDALRHSITKLSHLHFVTTKEYAQRVAQLGEEPHRIVLTGSLSLDNLKRLRLMSRRELERLVGMRFESPPLLVTFHSTTLEYERAEWQVRQLLKAMDQVSAPIVITAPNADTHGRIISRSLEQFVDGHKNARLMGTLGTRAYFSLMAVASAMIGNSSSGLIEASSFKLPVVNIGNRQRGRVRGPNVVDVGYETDSILGGMEKVLARGFRARFCRGENPYYSGGASRKIIAALKKLDFKKPSVVKHFCDGSHTASKGLK